LNRFIERYAYQSQQSQGARTYVSLSDDGKLAGFYMLTYGSVEDGLSFGGTYFEPIILPVSRSIVTCIEPELSSLSKSITTASRTRRFGSWSTVTFLMRSGIRGSGFRRDSIA
jgi:hypothetical protein